MSTLTDGVRKKIHYGLDLLATQERVRCKQVKLAMRVGVDKSYISKIEKGIIEPGIAMFYSIASALGMSVELNRRIAFEEVNK